MAIEQNVLLISGLLFTKAILGDLQKLQQYSGEPMAAVYADNLLRTMLIMRDKLPFDPYTEVVMALHDALRGRQLWLETTPDKLLGKVTKPIIRAFMRA